MLAGDSQASVRLDLARKISRLAPDLSRHEKTQLETLTLEALGLLAADVLPRVRQVIAEELKTLDNVPAEMMLLLARDVELVVAAPVLEYSPLLDDDSLLEIINSSPVQGALSAISRRQGLAAPLCDGIVANNDTEAVAELLERVRHRQNQKGDSQGSQKVIQAMSWVKGGQPWMTRPYSEDLRELELLNRGPLAMRRRSNLM